MTDEIPTETKCTNCGDLHEMTSDQCKSLENDNALYAVVEKYRADHNIKWGGPPYSAEEYRLIAIERQRLGI